MLSKTLALVAGAAGYVFGARAGRDRFEQIKEQATRVWNDPVDQKVAKPGSPHA